MGPLSKIKVDKQYYLKALAGGTLSINDRFPQTNWPLALMSGSKQRLWLMGSWGDLVWALPHKHRARQWAMSVHFDALKSSRNFDYDKAKNRAVAALRRKNEAI